MEDKKIIEEKLKRFEELLEKLERISDEKQHHHSYQGFVLFFGQSL